jgi:hypothetical protein
MIIAAIAGIGLAAASAFAQPSAQSPAPSAPAVDCPPGVQPPAIDGRGSSGRRESLSEQLAESKGIICPPAGIDREMQITPPAGGVIEVIPPPGTPGGDQSVQPK